MAARGAKTKRSPIKRLFYVKGLPRRAENDEMLVGSQKNPPATLDSDSYLCSIHSPFAHISKPGRRMSPAPLTHLMFVAWLSLCVAACGESEQTKSSESTSEVVEEAAATADTPAPYDAETVNANNIPKKYLVQSGMIEYQLSGVQTGTRTLFWDDWGFRQAIYEDSKTEVMGLSQSSKSKSINVADKSYSIDLTTNTGIETPNPADKILESISDEEAEEVTNRMMKSLGGEKIGTDTIAGKTCDVWTVAIGETETCVWQNIPLRNSVSVAGMTNVETATTVSVDIKVDAAHFEIPDGVTMTKLEELPGQTQ